MKFQNSKYKKKIILVNEFLETNLSLKIQDFIKYDNWKIDLKLCQNVLSDNLSTEDIKYLNNKLGSERLEHKKDKRNSNEYALDLITNWIMEDAILKIFKEEFHLECNLSSGDRNREFLLNPTAVSDFKLVTNSKKEQYLELMNDFTGYWKKELKIDLRDKKYPNLKKEKGILLGVNLFYGDFLLIDSTKFEDSRVKRIESHKPFGGKPACQLSLKDSDFYDKDGIKNYFTNL